MLGCGIDPMRISLFAGWQIPNDYTESRSFFLQAALTDIVTPFKHALSSSAMSKPQVMLWYDKKRNRSIMHRIISGSVGLWPESVKPRLRKFPDLGPARAEILRFSVSSVG